MSVVHRRLPLVLLACTGAVLLLGLGLWGWMHHAADIVLSLAAEGLSWCL